MDADKLRQMVRVFSFHSQPSSGIGSTPCTVDDINKVIENATKVFNAIIDELDENK
ncbi:hypothetical protein [Agathobaculum desmolans]|uniref:hypothetical protein n=1 Tax=Agathobaculum desmolans TaxID=39484 RepID=UPI000AE7A1B4|nr:hypothetical protein [Agathobaculum desmolans]